MTNNAYVAKQYAELAYAMGAKRILELGAGSGKFAYLFLKEMEKMGRDVRYVLSDFAEKNVSFWKSHPLLKPWIERGALECALYDPLRERCPFEPNLVIANYFFDTTPQELFRVEKGKLFEGRISLFGDAEDPEKIEELFDAYSYVEVKSSDYVEEELLEEYRMGFEKCSFLMPTGAFQTLRNLGERKFSMIVGDKGLSTLEQIGREPQPCLSLHGTFSYPVNFHAIGRWLEKRGGDACFPVAPSSAFTAALFASGMKLSEAVKKVYRKMSIGPVKATTVKELELANWDATLFFNLGEIDGEIADRAMESFFPLSREEAFLLAQLAEKLGEKGQKWITWGLQFKDLPSLPKVSAAALKPESVKFAEAAFPNIEEIVYTDQDIQWLLQNLPESATAEQVEKFLLELKARGQKK
jgi:hypothetical protein